MTAMSYESSWKDPATWETSIAWHSVERSMSTIFKRAYESYWQILQPTVFIHAFHGFPWYSGHLTRWVLLVLTAGSHTPPQDILEFHLANSQRDAVVISALSLLILIGADHKKQLKVI